MARVNPAAAGWSGGGGGGGDGDCEDCARWRQHFYWNHAGGDRKQFVIVASEGFRDRATIPPEVGSHLRNMIPDIEHVKLEAPDGRTYDVRIMMFYKMFLFTSGETSGWQEFVDANEIQEGYSIIFMYCGNSTFKVNISNLSGNENPSSFSEPPPKIFGAVPPPRASCDHHVPIKEQVVPDPPGHVDASTVVGFTLSSGCCLTKAQEEKVLELAHRMRSEIPLHVATMVKRNVKLKDSCIYIPLRLVDHFEPDITLKDHEDKIHGVRARKHDADQIVLASGWGEFVSKQRIQENDLIVFKKGKPHIEVFILEKTLSYFSTGNCSSAEEVIESSSSDVDDIVVQGTRKRRQLSGCGVKAKKMASVYSPCAKSEYGAPKLNEVGSEPLRSNISMGPSWRHWYILSNRKDLKGQAREKVEEKVQAICSEFPVFVKVMNKSSVSFRGACDLHFCMEYALECLPAKQNCLLLLEGDEREWTGKLDISRQGVRWIRGAWRKFLSQVRLEEGDICLFELVDKSAGWVTMKVHLIRRSEIRR